MSKEEYTDRYYMGIANPNLDLNNEEDTDDYLSNNSRKEIINAFIEYKKMLDWINDKKKQYNLNEIKLDDDFKASNKFYEALNLYDSCKESVGFVGNSMGFKYGVQTYLLYMSDHDYTDKFIVPLDASEISQTERDFVNKMYLPLLMSYKQILATTSDDIVNFNADNCESIELRDLSHEEIKRFLTTNRTSTLAMVRPSSLYPKTAKERKEFTTMINNAIAVGLLISAAITDEKRMAEALTLIGNTTPSTDYGKK